MSEPGSMEYWREIAREDRAALDKAKALNLKCIEEINSLRAQVEQAQWQPIETAPKDGTHVLVGTFPAPSGHITVATAHWFDGRNYGLKSGRGAWALSVNYDGDHSDHGVQAPTHWMPLPAPPAVPSDDGRHE